MPVLLRLALLALTVFLLPLLTPATAGSSKADWDKIVAAAKGQTVYWNAWGGDTRINAYIAWAGEQVAERYDLEVVHVKLTDTAEAVSRVLAEKTAGRIEGGAVDLIWINGENFAAMKRNGLLLEPWTEGLPNFALTDQANNPDLALDFGVPVDGLEMPWSRARLVFYRDEAALPEPPRSSAALLEWAKKNPGRFTYPLPPSFLGTTFLKQVLLERAANRDALYRPAGEADFASVTAPLWDYLDALHPLLWRKARSFPENAGAMRRLMSDGEIEIAFAFSQSEATAGIESGELPETVRNYVFDVGTIGNVSFVAIPFNAAHSEGARVLANFLLSPEAQLRKQDPEFWGSATVLALDALTADEAEAFRSMDLGPAALPADRLGSMLAEPYPSWTDALEEEWNRRYAVR
ncbi:ABC transporter substrate-binding protein [Nisaea acidiphila]|uniref:ABC transporter substrate-binding protein n=1 Tax=Nisaea acidiphila TaxID=1862145 RepID=A0A9J7ASJ6_9PROT|nr:ABC transporter substrate-binding protein [Nisaea acidiphila]UUX50635.1 ABC transporter substrate-binding protein [Nisaea acidiphila]